MAESDDFQLISDLCDKISGVFDELRNGKKPNDASINEILHRANDIEAILEAQSKLIEKEEGLCQEIMNQLNLLFDLTGSVNKDITNFINEIIELEGKLKKKHKDFDNSIKQIQNQARI